MPTSTADAARTSTAGPSLAAYTTGATLATRGATVPRGTAGSARSASPTRRGRRPTGRPPRATGAANFPRRGQIHTSREGKDTHHDQAGPRAPPRVITANGIV